MLYVLHERSKVKDVETSSSSVADSRELNTSTRRNYSSLLKCAKCKTYSLVLVGVVKCNSEKCGHCELRFKKIENLMYDIYDQQHTSCWSFGREMSHSGIIYMSEDDH